MKALQSWVLVAGGFHRRGGMDKANIALAEYLLERGAKVHLVAHDVDSSLALHPAVHVNRISRFGSILVSDFRLSKAGRAAAREAKAKDPNSRAVVNGGNCDWPDINWVHAVHHAWPCIDQDAALLFRLKNRVTKRVSKRREKRALRSARLVIVNSERTRSDVIRLLGVDDRRVRVLYLGAEPFNPPSADERWKARQEFGCNASEVMAVFAGALSMDSNKGFDTLFSAWQKLCQRPGWNGRLIVAGSGNGVPGWKKKAEAAGMSERILFAGFVDPIERLLAAADILISPVRYEAYGLNVQEAICRGIPAIVSRSAGVAERYPAGLSDYLLPDPEDAEDLANRLWQWRLRREEAKRQFEEFGRSLSRYSWRDMAERFVDLAEEAAVEGR
mgnify:FL=1